jgi:hypothetical protein
VLDPLREGRWNASIQASWKLASHHAFIFDQKFEPPLAQAGAIVVD